MEYKLGYSYNHCSITLYLESKKGRIPIRTTFHHLNWDDNTIKNIDNFITNEIYELISHAKLSDHLFKIDYERLGKEKNKICKNFSSYLQAKNKLLNVSIKEWYMENYPNDDLGKEVLNFSFKDLNNLLTYGEGDVYALIGCADSVIRERCFENLAKITELPYKSIYDKWLDLKEPEEVEEIEQER